MGERPAHDEANRGDGAQGKLVGQPPAGGKLSTGNPSIDLVLGGGIPRNSLYILTGPPGAGKTILGQQISFNSRFEGLSGLITGIPRFTDGHADGDGSAREQ